MIKGLKKRMAWFRRRSNQSETTHEDQQQHQEDPEQQQQQQQQEVDIEKQGGVQNMNSGSNNNNNNAADIKALSDEQVEDCKEAFCVFVDEEGLVDISNLGPMMRALGDKISDDDLQILSDKYDHAHFERGGKIDFYNFIELMKPRIIEKNEKYNEVSINQLFKEFDDDGDGYISAKELRQSLQKLGDNFAAVAEELTVEDVEEIMLESDLDGDGRIRYSEFTIMIPRLNQIIEE